MGYYMQSVIFMPSLIRMERKYILFICILLLFIWTTSIREEGFAEQKRFILLLRGEAFRKGGQNSRTIGLEDAYEEQMAACETHMELIRAVEAQGYTVEVYIDTYSTQYDKELRAAYGSYVKDARFHATRFGTQSLLIKDAANMLAGNMLADNRPDALLILRLDMFIGLTCRPYSFSPYAPVAGIRLRMGILGSTTFSSTFRKGRLTGCLCCTLRTFQCGTNCWTMFRSSTVPTIL